MEKDLAALMAAGADEFYLGYASRLPGAKEFQTRRYSFQANYPTLQTTESVIKQIRSQSKQVFVVFNEHFYTAEYQQQIIKDIKVLLQYGVTGFIIGDINLFLLVREKFPQSYIIGSIATHVINTQSAQHFKKMGFNRLVLDRHLTLPEIYEILRLNPDMEFELIIKNENCPNMDGLCTYVHGDIGGIHFGQGVCSKKDSNFIPQYDHFDCGSCALFELKEFDRLTLKIAGRDKPTQLVLQDVQYFKLIADKLKAAHDRAQYRSECINEYQNNYQRPCESHCYYDLTTLK